DGGAELFQAFRDCGCANIRARHPVAKVQQHFGDTTHPDATDANKVNVLESLKHFKGRPSAPPPTRPNSQSAPLHPESPCAVRWFQFLIAVLDYRSIHGRSLPAVFLLNPHC